MCVMCTARILWFNINRSATYSIGVLEMGKLTYGTVKWFSTRKGYGYIAGDDGIDYFVHFNDLEEQPGGKFKYLDQDGRVSFIPISTPKGLSASRVVRLTDMGGADGS